MSEKIDALVSAARYARDMLTAVAGEIEDGNLRCGLPGKYAMAVMKARDDLAESIAAVTAGATSIAKEVSEK